MKDVECVFLTLSEACPFGRSRKKCYLCGMKIGIFGGSFNPIHNGHVAIGRTMLSAMALDEVWYMLSPQNPLKQAADLLEEGKRFEIVKHALQGEPGLVAKDYEFSLPRPSYTWNTLQNLHRDYPGDEFILIIGGDNWEKFSKWAHHEDILATHRIAVFPREGAELTAEHPENVTFVKVPLVNVTSTMLRAMVRRGEDISAFVPAVVCSEIEREYRQFLTL